MLIERQTKYVSSFPGNSHGPMQVFTHSLEPLGPFPSPGYFPAIDLCHARLDEVQRLFSLKKCGRSLNFMRTAKAI